MRGDWTRADITRDRARIAAADALKKERLAHHMKYGDRMCSTHELYTFDDGTCTCWGCRGNVVGTESEGQE